MIRLKSSVFIFFYRIDIEKHKIVPRQFGQTFLLDNVKTQEINQNQNRENLRPKISDQISWMINSDSPLSIFKPSLDELRHKYNR